MIIVKKLYNITYIYIICEVFDQYFDNMCSVAYVSLFLYWIYVLIFLDDEIPSIRFFAGSIPFIQSVDLFESQISV